MKTLLTSTNVIPKTLWKLSAGEFQALYYFINTCEREVGIIILKQSTKILSLLKEEYKALKDHSKRNDIMIKIADKGCCLGKRPLHQLSTLWYQLLIGRLTMISLPCTGPIQSVIINAISAGHLPNSAQNLMVDNPHCNYFYLLPKIRRKNPVQKSCTKNPLFVFVPQKASRWHFPAHCSVQHIVHLWKTLHISYKSLNL